MTTNTHNHQDRVLAVALFVYRRPHHTHGVLSSLAKCDGSENVDLHIFSDGARDAESRDAVNTVRQVCREFLGDFRSVEILENESNLGLAASVIRGVTQVLENYDDVAVLEDDTEVSPTFVSYMRLVLDTYRAEPGVMSVSGYQFPKQTVRIPRSYRWDNYLSVRCASWGWGTWRDNWSLAEWDTATLLQELQKPEYEDLITEAGADFLGMLRQQERGAIDSWAVRFCASHILLRSRCLYPRYSLVRNTGLDGSGEHCSELVWLTHRELHPWIPTRLVPPGVIDERLAAQPGKAYAGNSSARAKFSRRRPSIRKQRTLSNPERNA